MIYRMLILLVLTTLLGLTIASSAQAQGNPLLRLNPASMALYRQAEPLDKAGDTAGVIAVWRARAEAGDDLAQFETGMVLMRSPAPSPETARGLELIRKSAESGFVRAQVRLYFLHRHGLPPLVEQDPARGIAWLRRAADQNFPAALVHLGLAYEGGLGVERNPKEAFALFQRAASHNHPFGHFAVAAAYESGIGVPVDIERARESYGKAIERAMWLETRPNVAYVYRQFYSKWISDSKAALAGLDRPVVAQAPAPVVDEERRKAEARTQAENARLTEERRKLEQEQARVADERRRIEAENAKFAAERRRAAEEAERRLAVEKKQVEEARLAEDRRRLEAERANLAEERQRLEAENARIAEEERRKAEERKQAEETRLAEERRQLEAEQARIAEERRRFEAETTRIAEERRRVEMETARIAEERQRVVEVEPRAQPVETPPQLAPSPAADRRGGENDFAMNFGRFVKGLATAVQVVSGVTAAVQGVRAGNQGSMAQGLDTALGALGLSGSASQGSDAANPSESNPAALLVGVVGAVAQGKTSAERRDLALQALTQQGQSGGSDKADLAFGGTIPDQNLTTLVGTIPDRHSCLKRVWLTSPVPRTAAAQGNPSLSEQPYFPPNNRRSNHRVLTLRNDCSEILQTVGFACHEERTTKPGNDKNGRWGAGELKGMYVQGNLLQTVPVGPGQHLWIGDEYSTTNSEHKSVMVVFGAWDSKLLQTIRGTENDKKLERKFRAVAKAYLVVMHGEIGASTGSLGRHGGSPIGFRRDRPPTSGCTDINPERIWRSTE